MPLKERVPVANAKLLLSLAKDEAVSIVPAGTRLAVNLIQAIKPRPRLRPLGLQGWPDSAGLRGAGRVGI